MQQSFNFIAIAHVVRHVCYCVVLMLVVISPALFASPLTLDKAIVLGQKADFQAQMIEKRLEAQKAKTIYAGTLPDPKLQVGLINLPTDNFDFDQDDMTQAKIGFSQQFPPGKTLELRQHVSELGTQQLSIVYQLRALQTKKEIADIWFELTFLDGQTLLLTRYQQVLQRLKSVVESSYTVGRSKQYDLIQLDLMNDEISNRLMATAQEKQQAISQLALWLGQQAYGTLALSFPERSFVKAIDQSWDAVQQQMAMHPEAQVKKLQIDEAIANLKIVEESYKPEWGLDMSYGYREDGGHGVDRSDFFSVMASVSLPIRSSNVQNQQVVAKLANKNVAQFGWQDVLQSLAARLTNVSTQAELLQKRRQAYQQKLIPQAEQQAEAALSAYKASAADFADVVDAELKFIDVHIDSIRIDMDFNKALNELNYLSVQKDN